MAHPIPDVDAGRTERNERSTQNHRGHGRLTLSLVRVRCGPEPLGCGEARRYLQELTWNAVALALAEFGDVSTIVCAPVLDMLPMV